MSDDTISQDKAEKQRLRALTQSEDFLLLIRRVVEPELRTTRMLLGRLANDRDKDMILKGQGEALKRFIDACTRLSEMPKLYAHLYAPIIDTAPPVAHPADSGEHLSTSPPEPHKKDAFLA